MRFLSKPGMWLQALTTREPDRKMMEVGIAAVEAVFDWRAYQAGMGVVFREEDDGLEIYAEEGETTALWETHPFQETEETGEEPVWTETSVQKEPVPAEVFPEEEPAPGEAAAPAETDTKETASQAAYGDDLDGIEIEELDIEDLVDEKPEKKPVKEKPQKKSFWGRKEKKTEKKAAAPAQRTAPEPPRAEPEEEDDWDWRNPVWAKKEPEEEKSGKESGKGEENPDIPEIIEKSRQ